MRRARAKLGRRQCSALQRNLKDSARRLEKTVVLQLLYRQWFAAGGDFKVGPLGSQQVKVCNELEWHETRAAIRYMEKKDITRWGFGI